MAAAPHAVRCFISVPIKKLFRYPSIGRLLANPVRLPGVSWMEAPDYFVDVQVTGAFRRFRHAVNTSWRTHDI